MQETPVRFGAAASYVVHRQLPLEPRLNNDTVVADSFIQQTYGRLFREMYIRYYGIKANRVMNLAELGRKTAAA
jgi:hypothetical protein